ncbi:hypothetical protein VTO73DRAFT_7984 [Trametes versicolor]
MPTLVMLRIYEFSGQPWLISEALPLLLVPGDSTPICCPLLSTLCIGTSTTVLDGLYPTDITQVLAERTRTGFPIRRFSLRAPLCAMHLQWAHRRTWRERVRKAFSGAAVFVEEMDLVLDGATPDAFVPRAALWDVPDDAKTYWTPPTRAHLLKQGFEPSAMPK